MKHLFFGRYRFSDWSFGVTLRKWHGPFMERCYSVSLLVGPWSWYAGVNRGA